VIVATTVILSAATAFANTPVAPLPDLDHEPFAALQSDTGGTILASCAASGCVAAKADELERQRLAELQAIIDAENARTAQLEQDIWNATHAPHAPSGGGSGGTDWEAVHQCEAGSWDTNTGNGYYGGLQFDTGTWDAYGNPACDQASDCSKEEQIAAAASMDYDAWPNC
jgi:hypothetical protein